MQEEVSVCSKNLFLNHASLLSKMRLVSESSSFNGFVLNTPFFRNGAASLSNYFPTFRRNKFF